MSVKRVREWEIERVLKKKIIPRRKQQFPPDLIVKILFSCLAHFQKKQNFAFPLPEHDGRDNPAFDDGTKGPDQVSGSSQEDRDLQTPVGRSGTHKWI